MEKTKYEKVDISLFDIIIPDNEYFNKTTCKLLKDNVKTCSIDIENKTLKLSFIDNFYTLKLSFIDNFYTNHEMFVYTKLLYMKYSKIILPRICIALHDLNGDIHISYEFINLKIDFFNDILNLSKNVNSNNDLELEAIFTYDIYNILFVINQNYENDSITITNKRSIITIYDEDTLDVEVHDTLNNENWIYVNN